MSRNDNPNPPPAEAPPAVQTSAVKRVMFTTKVRRGLGLVAVFAVNAFDPDTAPGFTAAARLSRAQRSDLDAALDWLEQNAQTDPDLTTSASYLRGRARALLDLAGAGR